MEEVSIKNDNINIKNEKTYKVGDFYWDYADIMRGMGMKETIYDERILAFMAIKLLIDNKKLNFNLIYKNDKNELLPLPFGLSENSEYIIYNSDKGIDYRQTFLNIIQNIDKFDNTSYFMAYEKNAKEQTLKEYEKYNLEKYNVSNELQVLNTSNVFEMKKYIFELPEEKFLAVLDIYNIKANFINYPRSKYKNLYEDTVSRMKKLAGALTGQHFTQTSIINLMTRIGVSHIKKDKNEIVIYDPSCGVGSMLYDSAYYAAEEIYGCKNKDEISNDNEENCVLKHFLLLGQEINGPTWFLAKVFSEISGFKNFIALGNTLIEPILPIFIKEKNIDFLIANPPFGMDWKTEKTKVEKALEFGLSNPEESIFHVIPNTEYNPKKKDSKSYASPKISDGQWLFFMHIAKALENNPNAKAVILSSTSLLSNGDEKSNEGIIRKYFIENGFIETVIEQPNSMFTNTDIKTHLWVMDKSDKNINNVQIIKIDNEFINKKFKDKNKKQLKTIRILFDKAEYQIEKQKNGYSSENVNLIINLYNRKEECPLFVLNITPAYFEKNKDYVISFEQLFNFSVETGEVNILKNMDNIEKTEKVFHKIYFNGCEEYNICESVEKVQKYINGSIYCDDEYFEQYQSIYNEMKEKIKSETKLIAVSADFKDNFSKIEKSINENIQKHFDKAWEII